MARESLSKPETCGRFPVAPSLCPVPWALWLLLPTVLVLLWWAFVGLAAAADLTPPTPLPPWGRGEPIASPPSPVGFGPARGQVQRAGGLGPYSAFAPGRVLVKPEGGLYLPLSALPGKYPVAVVGSIPGLGVLILEVPAGREEETVGQLRENPRVEWAEPDYLRDTMETVPNDQFYRQFQWNLRKIQADRAWDITTGSREVVVAILDTGTDRTHPDLEGKLVAGYDFLNDSSDPDDDSGHGTHKAGVVAAVSNNGVGVAGVSWGARLMPIKVLNSSGLGPDSAIARGITYAVDHGARVLNMSFGSSTSSNVLASAVSYAVSKGALLVAAAGNTARMDNPGIYPAGYDGVMAVAATDEADKAADFSQHHPYVAVSAPGVHIVSTFWRGAGYGSYVSSSGTSDAAPHVSGLAALIWSANPALTNAQVRQLLEDTADDLGPPGRDEYFGFGRINAYRAVQAAKPGATPVATSPTLPGPTPPAGAGPVAIPATLPRTVWYFADASSESPFDLWLLLQNPNSTAATAKITYTRENGARVTQEVGIPPISRRAIFVNQEIPDARVSMRVESEALLFAERVLYTGTNAHDAVGVAAPSHHWYLAEGNTRSGFDTRILLQNPLDTPSSATVTFFDSGGRRKEVSVDLPPLSRRSIHVNPLMPEAEVSTMVVSDGPILVERAMSFPGTGSFGGVGVSQLARSWYLAGGRADSDSDTWLLVLNPNTSAANLKVTFLREDGSGSMANHVVPPGSRLSLYANELVSAGRFGARVESDQPIVVERSTYFGDERGGHNTAGTPLLSREWYLPEGSTRTPFTETISVANPNDRTANLAVTFMKEGGGSSTHYCAVNRGSRLTLNVSELMPDSEVSAKVVSDVPVAVERSMYFSGGLGGASAAGIPR